MAIEEFLIIDEIRSRLEEWSSREPSRARAYRLALRVLGAIAGAGLGAFVAYIVAQKYEGPPPVDPGYVVFGALVGLLPGYLFYIVSLYAFAFFYCAVGPDNYG